MSWSSTSQPPTRIASIRAGDTADRSFDMTIPLGTDTIQSVTSINVVRVSGQPTTPDDLTISNSSPPSPDTTGKMVEFQVTAAIALLTTGQIDYQLTFTVVTVGGETLVRDGFLAVVAPMGPTQ